MACVTGPSAPGQAGHDQLPWKPQLHHHVIISLPLLLLPMFSFLSFLPEVRNFPFVLSGIPVCSLVPVTSYGFEWLIKRPLIDLSIDSSPSFPFTLPPPNKYVSGTYFAILPSPQELSR